MNDYKIVWKGTDGDFFPKRMDSNGKIYKPEVHVLHIMEGTLESTDSWFNNGNVSASTHYGIGYDGRIHQYVRTEDAAWGNGLLTNPNWKWAKQYPNVNPNLYTISYELEGYSGEHPKPEQFKSLIYLLKLNSQRYEIPLEVDRFIGHYIIDPVNRAFCNGSGFPWNDLYRELNISVHAVDLPVLAIGSKGPNVEYLQVRLHKLGQDVGAHDGIFGVKTLRAVKNFQSLMGLTVDGIVGPLTWAKIS